MHAIRLPKAITAILAGAALSVSGLIMQTLFRNPLAGPYTLGVSSGASLGVALLTMLGAFIPSFLQPSYGGLHRRNRCVAARVGGQSAGDQ